MTTDMTPAEFRAARAKLGLTQGTLAEWLGFTGKRGRRTVGDIECGRRTPSGTVILLLQAYVDGYRP